MSRVRAPLLMLLLALGAVAGLAAPAAAQQQPEEPLERFLEHVARLWRAEDADALVALAADGKVALDTGEGRAQVGARHAAAALRALFGERDTRLVRPLRATFAGGQPAQGFGELAWEFGVRGVPAPRVQSVYVGTRWDDGGWRITELRVMR